MLSLFGARREFTIVDSRALTESSPAGGALIHGSLNWHVVVLPETERSAAALTAERLRSAVESLEFPFEDGTELRITTSVGISILAAAGESLDSLMARADGALYEAKREGRNRVVIV